MQTTRAAVMAGILGFAAATTVLKAAPDLTGNFDSDTESWRTSIVGATLTWQSTGGTTGAYLEGEGPGDSWYFVSPASWSGDWSDYRALKFDLGIPSRHYPDGDTAGLVVIVGLR